MTGAPPVEGTLGRQLAGILEKRILTGGLQAGHRLPTVSALETEFRVSRSVVRDALRTLAARGLVEIRQGIGTVVTAPGDDAYSDAILLALARADLMVGEVLRTRAIIERVTALSAAARHTDDDCVTMRAHIDALARATERHAWEEALNSHLRWHLSILDATHLAALAVLLKPMQRIIMATSLPPVIDDARYYDIPAEYALLDAIISRDESSVNLAIERHFAFIDDPAYASTLQLPLRTVSGTGDGQADALRYPAIDASSAEGVGDEDLNELGITTESFRWLARRIAGP
jgi:GntR family transcriptional regulator, transcriptional repressor for pyruvate dehydrogenase complex